MRFLHFLAFQLRWYIWRKRWLLPLPVLLFIAYRSYNAVRALGASGVTLPNAWDVLFLALGNPYNIYLAIGLLYLYLLCDLLPEPELGQLVLFRLGSRRSWWLGKLATLTIATLIYVIGSAAILALIASLAFPWQAGYSTAAMNMPEQVNLPMNYFRLIDPGPPLLVIGQELLLLGLGLFCFGLLMMVFTQLTQRYFIGLVVGVLILFGSFAGLRSQRTASLGGDTSQRSPDLSHVLAGSHLVSHWISPILERLDRNAGRNWLQAQPQARSPVYYPP